jgi:hypothetical protein
LLGEAYWDAASLGTAISGFARAGIWAVNRDDFQKSFFVPSISKDLMVNNGGTTESLVNILKVHHHQTVQLVDTKREK